MTPRRCSRETNTPKPRTFYRATSTAYTPVTDRCPVRLAISADVYAKPIDVTNDPQHSSRIPAGVGGRAPANPLQVVAKESIYGRHKAGREMISESPPKVDGRNQQNFLSERERRLLLRENERKARAAGLTGEAYGQLSAAGANIIEQKSYAPEYEAEGRSSRPTGNWVTGAEQPRASPQAKDKNEAAGGNQEPSTAGEPRPAPRLPSEEHVALREGSARKAGELSARHFELPEGGTSKLEEEARKKEEYRKYLQAQMVEQQERKKTSTQEAFAPSRQLSSTKQSEAAEEHYPRYKKKAHEAEAGDKRELQKALMQAELNKQIEERKARKAEEKLREKEEALREEQRLQKEKTELEARYRVDVLKEGRSGKLKAPKPPAAPVNAPSPGDNAFVHVVQGHSTNILRQTKMERKTATKEHGSAGETAPTVVANKLPTLPAAQSGKEDKGSVAANRRRMLEGCRKQIEALQHEKLLAKEEALLYKEQLLAERELYLQRQMLQLPTHHPPFAVPETVIPTLPKSPHQTAPETVPQRLLPTHPELPSQPQFHLPTQSPSQSQLPSQPQFQQQYQLQLQLHPQIPAQSQSQLQTGLKGDSTLLEQSLRSNTKLVAFVPSVTNTQDLYTTWNPANLLQEQQQLPQLPEAQEATTSPREAERPAQGPSTAPRDDPKTRLRVEAGIQAAEHEKRGPSGFGPGHPRHHPHAVRHKEPLPESKFGTKVASRGRLRTSVL